MKYLFIFLFSVLTVVSVKAANYEEDYNSGSTIKSISVEYGKEYSFKVTNVPKDLWIEWHINNEYQYTDQTSWLGISPTFNGTFYKNGSCEIRIYENKSLLSTYRWEISIIKPDLSVSSLNVTPYQNVEPGSKLDWSYTVTNIGDKESESCKAKFVLVNSNGTIIQDPLDIDNDLDDKSTIEKLGPDESINKTSDQSINFRIKLPETLSDGTYHVRVIVDCDSDLGEDNTGNNTDEDQITVSDDKILSAQWVNSGYQSIEDTELPACETVYLQIKTNGYSEGNKFSLVIKERDQIIFDKDDFVETVSIEIDKNGIGTGSWNTIYTYKQTTEKALKSTSSGLPNSNPHPDYYFEVQKISDDNSLFKSGYIEVIDKENPPAPNLSYPDNNKEFITTTTYREITFGWDEITSSCRAEIENYKIEIASDNAFEDIIKDGKTSDNTKTFSLGIGTYYWRVAAQNTAGYPSEWVDANWSETRKFEVLYDGIEEALKISPENISCKGDKPLLLVHGWQYNGMPANYGGAVWENFKEFYKNDSDNKYGEDLKDVYKIYNVEYKSNLVSVEELGDLFREKVSELGLDDITIVAHSMGGLVSRAFMESSYNGVKGGELVDFLITLGTPHHGSPMANGPVKAIQFPGLVAIISLFDAAYFYFTNAPEYYERNRLDLHWDNFDNLFSPWSYTMSSEEPNEWLINLNSQTAYDSKIIAYGCDWNGIKHALENNAVCQAGYYSMKEMGIIQANPKLRKNDGIVPISSAHFDDHNVKYTRTLYLYNHFRMGKGNDGKDDKLFAQYIKSDLLNNLFSFLTLSGDSIIFENTQINNSLEETIILNNNGSKNINISDLNISGINADEFSIVNSNKNFEIQPGKSVELAVRFSPRTEGDKLATVNIKNDSDNEGPNKTIILSGYSSDVTKILEVSSGNMLDFGMVSVNETEYQQLTLSNSGNSDINVSGVLIDGEDNDQFYISSPDDLTSLTIPAGESLNFTIAFSPDSEGSKLASLTILNDSDNKGTETTILLSGTGTDVQLKLLKTSPSYSLDFGIIEVGLSETKTITIENKGEVTLVVTGMDIDGSDAEQFSFEEPGNTSFEILPESNQSIPINFNPSSDGLKTATLNIYNDSDNESPVKTVVLYGTTEVQTFEIAASPNSNERGSVTGSGKYELDQICNLTATAGTGYDFINWTEGGVEISTTPAYSFTVTSDRTLVANFEPQPHTITASADPITGGTVSGTGSYDHGQTCNLTATAKTGYNFINWTESGVQVSINPSYSFTVSTGRTLVANFESSSYTIAASADPVAGGTVSGTGGYDYGQTCNLTATAGTGYDFINWTEGDVEVSTSPAYSFTVTSDRMLVANFEPQSYTIAASGDPITGGTVSGTGSFEYGQTCSLTATAGTGYNFINWTEGGVQVSINPSYSFTVTTGRTLVANFTPQPYTITASADPIAGGAVSGAGGYDYGQACNLTATAGKGYDFINWTEGGVEVSTNTNYNFTVTKSKTLVANFEIQTFEITASVNPYDGGTVTGNRNYEYGETCDLKAIPESDYKFENWSEDGVNICSNPDYSFSVTRNRILVANFEIQSSPCSNPISNVPDKIGTDSVTMICSASGGSGGVYRYKWYKGTSCSGTVQGTNSTLTITESGNYTCKVYIADCDEATYYSCDYGYANVIPACSSPVSNVPDNSGTGSVTMTCSASDGSGGTYLYKWYNGTSCSGTILGINSTLTVTESGNYTCKVYIAGCDEATYYSCDYGYANVIPPCSNPISNVPDKIGTDSVTMICSASGGSGGAYRYKWYKGTSCTDPFLGTDPTFTVTDSGYYACKVYITGYETTCFSCSFGYATVNPGTGIEKNYAESNVKVYPNPFKDEVFIALENADEIQNIEVFNTIGIKVKEVTNIHLAETSLNMTNIEKGMYCLIISSKKGIYYKNIVKF